MIRLQKKLGTVLKWGTLFSTLGFVACTLIQIYARFFLDKAPSWTEEAARLCFVFAVGCAAGIALKGNYYVHFDFLYNKLGSAWKKRVLFLVDALTFLLFLCFSIYSIVFVIAGWAEKSPSLKFPMAVAFLGLAFLGVSISFFCLVRLVKHFNPKSPRS